MQKHTSRLFVLLLALLFLPSIMLSVRGMEREENGWLVTTAGFQGRSSLLRYTGTESVVTIPDSAGGLSFSTIGEFAFSENVHVTSVTVPDTINLVVHKAFAGCANLQEVTFLGEPEWQAAIFENCPKLERVNIPSSVRSISNSTFKNCTGLASIVIPETVGSIEFQAFAGCSGLQEIQFMDFVSIQPDAFTGVTATVKYSNARWPEEKRLNYGGNLTWVPVAEYKILSVSAEPSYIRGCGQDLTIVFQGAMSEIDRIEGPRSNPMFNIAEKELTPDDYTLTQGVSPDQTVLTVKADYVTNVQDSYAGFSIYFKNGYRIGASVRLEQPIATQPTPTEPAPTVPVTTAPPTVPETTAPPATVPETTAPPTTVPETTAPPTVPATTEPVAESEPVEESSVPPTTLTATSEPATKPVPAEPPDADGSDAGQSWMPAAILAVLVAALGVALWFWKHPPVKKS